MTPKYSLVIRWSEEDQCFIAWVPEFGTGVKTHGDTYQEAAKMGQEIIELMIESQTLRESLPEPWLYTGPEADDRMEQALLPSDKTYRASTFVPGKMRVKNVTA